MQTLLHSKPEVLEDILWKTALETIDKTEMDSACGSSLRAWITIGVQRMERQHRLTAEDLAIAHANLVKLIGLMKKEALFAGKPDHLDIGVFHATRRRLKRQASLTTFALWPFWPHNFVVST